MNRQQGIGLTELLISLFLTSMLFVVLMHVYLSHKQSYSRAQALIKSQVDLLWIKDMLSHSIRSAGFSPCVPLKQLEIVDHRAHGSHDLAALHIQHGNQRAIQIHRMSEEFVRVQEVLHRSQVLVAQEVVFAPQKPVMIADCQHAEILEVAAAEGYVAGQKVTFSTPLFFSYPDLAYLGEWVEESWFMQRNAAGHLALYYKLTRAEEVSTLVHLAAIQEKTTAHRVMVEIAFGLEFGQNQNLIVAVRGI